MFTLLLSAGLVAGAAGGAGAAPPEPSGDARDFRFKTCLHSVSYSGVWRGQAVLGVDEFLEKAKRLGYEGVMLMAKRPHVSPLDYDADARARLKRRIEDLGLRLVCLAGYTDFTAGIDRTGVPHAEIQALYVGEVARLARDLGTDMVRIFTGYERNGLPYDRQYATVLEGLRLAGREVARYGVTLAVQNHHDIAIHHDAMRWMLREVGLPNVRAAFDAWAPALQGLPPAEIAGAVKSLAPFIVHTTVAQYERHPRFRYEAPLTNYIREDDVIRAVPIDRPGIIDYDAFFQALKSIGYRGYVAYEMCEVLDGGGSIENLDRAARAFVEYARKWQ